MKIYREIPNKTTINRDSNLQSEKEFDIQKFNFGNAMVNCYLIGVLMVHNSQNVNGNAALNYYAAIFIYSNQSICNLARNGLSNNLILI